MRHSICCDFTHVSLYTCALRKAKIWRSLRESISNGSEAFAAYTRCLVTLSCVQDEHLKSTLTLACGRQRNPHVVVAQEPVVLHSHHQIHDYRTAVVSAHVTGAGTRLPTQGKATHVTSIAVQGH